MSDSDLGDDIVQDELPHHIPAVRAMRTDFKAWHRVRKQFIREKQWNHEIHFLVKKLRKELQKEESEWGAGPADGSTGAVGAVPEEVRVDRPLRCFVLPGDELLDIRCLWQRLEGEGCFLKFLGFNSSISSDDRREKIAVAENAVTQLSKICKDSHVTGDTFQDIARNTTQAYRLFRQYGPYDVVNLDLCDSLVPRAKADETQANYSALHQILIFQIQRQRTPWLLFATTQVDRSTADQFEINRLAAPTRENCDNHADFAAALATRVPEAAFRSKDQVLDLSQLNASQLTEIFGILLGKWLLSVLKSASPPCTVKLLTSYRYSIRSDLGVEMLSLGFLITPNYALPVDSTGISGLQPTVRQASTEAQIALDFVDVAARIRDVDQILGADTALRDKLAAEKAALLAASGFDAAAYLKWVADGEAETR